MLSNVTILYTPRATCIQKRPKRKSARGADTCVAVEALEVKANAEDEDGVKADEDVVDSLK